MVGTALAGGLGIGAGVGISSVALAPFNAANTFMGSAFFGYGMILGERYMYQADWPKIQQRLENGEKIENIIQEYTGRFTATVMSEAKIIFDTVTREFLEIMRQALASGTEGLEEHLAHGHLPHTGGLDVPPDLVIKQPKVQPNPQYVPQPEKFNPPSQSQVPLSVQRNVKSWVRDLASTQVKISQIRANLSRKFSSNRVPLELKKNRAYQQLVALRQFMSLQLNKQVAIYGAALNPYLR